MRGIKIAVEALKSQGFEMVPITFDEAMVKEHRNIMIAILIKFFLGPMLRLLDAKYERPAPCYTLIKAYSGSFIIRTLLRSLLWITGNRRILDSLSHIKEFDDEKMHDILVR